MRIWVRIRMTQSGCRPVLAPNCSMAITKSAIKSLQHALELQPDSPGLLTDMGSAYFRACRIYRQTRSITAMRLNAWGKHWPSHRTILLRCSIAPSPANACFSTPKLWTTGSITSASIRKGNGRTKRARGWTPLNRELQQHEKSQREPLLTSGGDSPEQIMIRLFAPR